MLPSFLGVLPILIPSLCVLALSCDQSHGANMYHSCMSGPVLGLGNTVVNKTDHVVTLMELQVGAQSRK
jgi:hypothetical protein